MKHGEGNANSPEFAVIKIFAISLPSKSFLGSHLRFQNSLLKGTHIFTTGLLGLNTIGMASKHVV